CCRTSARSRSARRPRSWRAILTPRWRSGGRSFATPTFVSTVENALDSSKGGTPMFDLFQFVADCREALAADKSQKFVREDVARAVSDPAAVLAALGEPQRAGLHKLYQSNELTVLNVVWAPMMTIMPHNHQMWAVIGIYTGREDNIFWRRVPGVAGKVEAAGAKAPCSGEAEPLGRNIIHFVTN